jgi:hypothetical protein
MELTTKQKDELYDYLYENRFKFINKKTYPEKVQSINNISIEIFDIKFDSFESCFEYLTSHWDKKCKNEKCKNERKLLSLFPNRIEYLNIKKKYGIFKFCHLKECNYESISERQRGDKNTYHRISPDKMRKMRESHSKLMIEKIRNGEFVPNITNSWAKSRCDIQFERGSELIKLKTRSSWDAYFQLFNKNFFYEKIIISYKIDGIYRNYIVDFVDLDNRILYEIKPNSVRNDERNLIKYKYARNWCIKN